MKYFGGGSVRLCVSDSDYEVFGVLFSALYCVRYVGELLWVDW